MISSFQNVNEEFFKQFAGPEMDSFIVFEDYRKNSFEVSIRTSFNGADGRVEDTREKYPCIIITPFTPVFRDGHRPDEKDFYTGPVDTDNDDEVDSVKKIFGPIAMNFRYEVNICSKNDRHHLSMQQWFIKKFENHAQNFFEFNIEGVSNTIWGSENICEKVEFDFNHVADPFRTDGVRESLYEFMVYPYVYVRDPENIPLISTVNFGLSNVTNIKI